MKWYKIQETVSGAGGTRMFWESQGPSRTDLLEYHESIAPRLARFAGEPTIRIMSTRKKLPDYKNMAGYDCCSEHLKQILEKYPNDFEFYPVKLLGKKGEDGNEVWGNYYVFNCLNSLDCIDLEKSECEVIEHRDGRKFIDVTNTRCLAIKNNLRIDVKAFRPTVSPRMIFISEQIAIEWVKSKMTGAFVVDISRWDEWKSAGPEVN